MEDEDKKKLPFKSVGNDNDDDTEELLKEQMEVEQADIDLQLEEYERELAAVRTADAEAAGAFAYSQLKDRLICVDPNDHINCTKCGNRMWMKDVAKGLPTLEAMMHLIPPPINQRVGRCPRCKHWGGVGSICRFCIWFYEEIDWENVSIDDTKISDNNLSVDQDEDGHDNDAGSETDSQVAEYLADKFCNSPMKPSQDETD
jgi:DNA-directed RNA polymerase subunit RPC12/RpoP